MKIVWTNFNIFKECFPCKNVHFLRLTEILLLRRQAVSPVKNPGIYFTSRYSVSKKKLMLVFCNVSLCAYSNMCVWHEVMCETKTERWNRHTVFMCTNWVSIVKILTHSMIINEMELLRQHIWKRTVCHWDVYTEYFIFL